MSSIEAILQSRAFWSWAVPIGFGLVFAILVVQSQERRRRAPPTEPTQVAAPSETFLDIVLRTPMPLAAAVGAGLALVFNVGFFAAVGISFMSLFSFQEHIVFALSGLVGVLVLTLGVIAAYNITSDLHVWRTGTVAWRLFGLFVLGFGASFWPWLTIVAAHADAGYLTAFTRAALFVVGVFFFLLLRYGEANIVNVVVATCLLFVGSALLGAYFGNDRVRSKSEWQDNWAITSTGERYGIVRIGADYSLLVTEQLVVRAFRTSELSGIYANKAFPSEIVAPP